MRCYGWCFRLLCCWLSENRLLLCQVNTHRLLAFDSPNQDPLATIGITIDENEHLILPVSLETTNPTASICLGSQLSHPTYDTF